MTQAGQEELLPGVLPSCLSWTGPAQLLVEALDIVGQVGTLQPGLMNQHEGCSVLWYGWKTRVELALKVSKSEQRLANLAGQVRLELGSFPADTSQGQLDLVLLLNAPGAEGTVKLGQETDCRKAGLALEEGGLIANRLVAFWVRLAQEEIGNSLRWCSWITHGEGCQPSW